MDGMPDSATATLWWWWTLRTIALLNIVAWLVLARWLWRVRAHWPPDDWAHGRAQWLLAGGYVLGCAWRSLLPVFDVPRIVMVDSVLSSVLVGRSVATVAELCFAAQWTLLLRQAARLTGHVGARRLSRAVLPLIATAELCSWHAVLTTANLGHVIEESLWALTVGAIVALLPALWPQVSAGLRRVLALWGVAGAAYVGYMVAVDVPMYWARWQAQRAAGHAPRELEAGVIDAASRWTVSHDWSIWHTEVGWMTAYFSVAVWLSLGLVAAARPGPAGAPTGGARPDGRG
ncbi:hypothetical protein [Pseudaquabacterium rugosum]|uniref:Uncharacterized protein n=1 Tax=Pseudaquabacterium rugosum TaxID=2984194 RepID=A0ABU9BET4_9BURK